MIELETCANTAPIERFHPPAPLPLYPSPAYKHEELEGGDTIRPVTTEMLDDFVTTDILILYPYDANRQMSTPERLLPDILNGGGGPTTRGIPTFWYGPTSLPCLSDSGYDTVYVSD
jgi:hypothetical protein